MVQEEMEQRLGGLSAIHGRNPSAYCYRLLPALDILCISLLSPTPSGLRPSVPGREKENERKIISDEDNNGNTSITTTTTNNDK